MRTSESDYMPSADIELIEKTLLGDYKAFEELILKHKDEVFHVAFSMTLSRDMAEDITQEVFVKTYFGLKGFKFHSNFSTWLYRITKNTAYNFLKKERRHKTISMDKITYGYESGRQTDKNGGNMYLSEDKSNEMKSVSSDDMVRQTLVKKALDDLPEKYKTPLLLKEFQGMRYEEIGRMLGISLEQVKIRIYRARKKLEEKIVSF